MVEGIQNETSVNVGPSLFSVDPLLKQIIHLQEKKIEKINQTNLVNHVEHNEKMLPKYTGIFINNRDCNTLNAANVSPIVI